MRTADSGQRTPWLVRFVGKICKKVVSIFELSQFLRPVAGMPPNLFSVYQGMVFGEPLIFCGRKYFWRADRLTLCLANFFQYRAYVGTSGPIRES